MQLQLSVLVGLLMTLMAGIIVMYASIFWIPITPRQKRNWLLSGINDEAEKSGLSETFLNFVAEHDVCLTKDPIFKNPDTWNRYSAYELGRCVGLLHKTELLDTLLPLSEHSLVHSFTGTGFSLVQDKKNKLMEDTTASSLSRHLQTLSPLKSARYSKDFWDGIKRILK